MHAPHPQRLNIFPTLSREASNTQLGNINSTLLSSLLTSKFTLLTAHFTHSKQLGGSIVMYNLDHKSCHTAIQKIFSRDINTFHYPKANYSTAQRAAISECDILDENLQQI